MEQFAEEYADWMVSSVQWWEQRIAEQNAWDNIDDTLYVAELAAA